VKRWVFNLLAGVSLVLCVGTAALWVRAYWSWDTLFCTIRWHSWSHIQNKPLYFGATPRFVTIRELTGTGIAVTNDSGCMELNLEYTDDSLLDHKAQPAVHFSLQQAPIKPAERSLSVPPGWDLHGFRSSTGASGDLDNHGAIRDLNFQYTYMISDWLVMMVFAVFPALWVVARVRQSRKRVGYCRSCGYDLRATPGRCPECGTVVGEKDVVSN
jgi:hypothetical protein